MRGNARELGVDGGQSLLILEGHRLDWLAFPGNPHGVPEDDGSH